MKPTVVHVITQLGSGGAERMLLRLVRASTRYQHVVVSLTGERALAMELRMAGADVITMRMRRYVPSLRAIFRLARLIRRDRPLILQTWLYHADLVGLLAARLANFRPIIWNLRCSNMDLSQYRWSTRMVAKLLIWLSSWPDMVMVNSEAGRQWHTNLGYRPKRWELVPNGIDTTVFRPDADARARWRQHLKVQDSDVLVGMVARRDPMKDHTNILRAAAEAARLRPGIVFVFAGRGVSRSDPELAQLADDVSVPVHLIGECDDPAGLNAALDVAVLSSAFGEGFPNVVAEAMAAGVPCVTTDVGDAAAIVDGTGLVVPPNDPVALAAAISTLASDAALRARMSIAARRRIEQHYGLAAAADRYEALWHHLAARSQVDIDRSTREIRAAVQQSAHDGEPSYQTVAKKRGLLLKILRLGLPVAITAVALAVALSRFDRHRLWTTVAALRPWTLALVLPALFAGNLLACVRLKVIAGDLHHPISFRDAFAATVLGQLAGSFFFQIVGQTMARSAVLSKIGISMPATIVITGYERVVAAVVSLLLALAGAFYLFGHITLDLAGGGEELFKIIAGITAVAFGGAMFAWGNLARRALRHAALAHAAVIYCRASVISVLIQLTTMAAYLAVAINLTHSISLVNLVAATTLVMFAASVLISLAGWGVREVSAVYALGAIGVPYDASLVVALLIGFSSIAILAIMALVSSSFVPAAPSSAKGADRPGADAFYSNFLNWAIPLFVASAVFFQIYVPVGIGKLNVNLADSVVLFGGALFVRHLLSRGIKASSARVPGLGTMVALMTLVVALAFMHGWIVDGWTTWASTNRLFGWFVLLAYAGTGALLALQKDADGFHVLLWTFIAAGLAVAALELILLLAVAVGVPVPQSLLGLRIEGFAQNPNAFGFQLLLVITVIFALRVIGWRHYVMLALAFMALYFTASRAAEGTGAIICSAAVALRYASMRSLVMPLAWAAAGVLGIFLIGHITWPINGSASINGNSPSLVMSYFDTNILQITNVNPAYKSNADRWLSDISGVQMFLAHPVFGAGLGAFVTSFEHAHNKFLIIHSTPIWLLAETGLVGFAVFAAPYVYVLYREIRASMEMPPDSARILLVLILLAFGVMSQAHDLMYQRPFWFLLGAALFSTAPRSQPQANEIHVANAARGTVTTP